MLAIFSILLAPLCWTADSAPGGRDLGGVLRVHQVHLHRVELRQTLLLNLLQKLTLRLLPARLRHLQAMEAPTTLPDLKVCIDKVQCICATPQSMITCRIQSAFICPDMRTSHRKYHGLLVQGKFNFENFKIRKNV